MIGRMYPFIKAVSKSGEKYLYRLWTTYMNADEKHACGKSIAPNWMAKRIDKAVQMCLVRL
jgi:hypothetical protein